MIFVPSAGRCGSSYFSKVLQKSGLICPNGMIGDDGGVGWEIAPILKDLHLTSQDIIIHQRRGARQQISSMQSFHPSCWERAKTLGAKVTGDVIRDAMQLWLDWTRECMELTDKQFFIEDIHKPETRRQIEQWLGYERRGLQWDAVDTDFNHREYKLLYWHDMDFIAPELMDEIFKLEAMRC